MTKRHVQHANGVWTYEVTLDPSEGATIPVLSPHQMEAWIKAVNARLGVVCTAAQVQREIAVWEVSS